MADREDSQSGSSVAFSIVGAVFSAIGGIGLLSAQKSRRTKEYLLNTPRTKLEDVQYFNTEPIFLKLQGQIQADEPITCEISKEKAAIYEKKKVGVWYSWRSRQGSESEYLADHFRRKTPFYIHEGNKKAKVYINDTPTQPELETVHQHDEPGGNFLLSLFLSTFRVHYPYKYIITENILPLNKQLLALGIVSRRSDGSLHISAPKPSFFSLNEKPYILSLKSEEELADDLDNKIFSSTVFGSLGLGVGVACFAAAFFSGRS